MAVIFSSSIKKLVYCIILFFCSCLYSEPWIGTENLSLRADIQLLADFKLLSTPTTTFPLMWGNIVTELDEIDFETLPEITVPAYLNVKLHAKKALLPQTRLRLNISNNGKRFTSFGDTFRDKSSINLNTSSSGNNWAGKLTVSFINDPVDGKEQRFDDSYASVNWGNWVLTAGLQNRWWGPGWDTNMALTNNARPIPAISLSRNSSEAFDLPFFNQVKIPWTLTTFMGRMEKERVIPNTLLWGLRITARPVPQLEVGITRLAQWDGYGRPGNLSIFWDLLAGRDNCGIEGLNCDNNQEPGNQMAGWDARWSSIIAQKPYSIYMQGLAEDGSERPTKYLTEIRYLLGLDTHLILFEQNIRLFLEASDTYADCQGDNNAGVGNCFYEHHIYRTGMRFNRRAINNIYENDARSYVLGFISQTNKTSNWQVKLRYLKLNQDDSDIALGNPFVGNTLTEIAEDMIMLSAKYQWQSNQWSYSIAGQLSKSTYEDAGQLKVLSLFTSASYSF